jgi:hypothetical protein
MLNGPVHITTSTIKVVVASAAEAEYAALFHNCKEAEDIRNTLTALRFPQPATPVQTDNTTANGLANGTVKRRQSKAMDVRWEWVKDRVRQGHFQVYWAAGKGNLADYFTKHHPHKHHSFIRPIYIYEGAASPEVLPPILHAPTEPPPR